MWRSRRVLGTCLLALSAAAPLRADEPRELDLAVAESRATARAAARVLPSVAALRALGKGRDGYGAGIFVREDGLLLTALHVVKDASAIAVVLSDGEEHPAKLVGSHPATDLALLRVIAPGKTFAPAAFAPDDAILVGETVIAVSNPFGLGTSVSRGVLSARGRRHVVEGNDAPLLQTDAAINPGSSGGALVNLRGEVVGLITAILTRSGGHEGVGFAVPSLELERAWRHLAKGETVLSPWLGLRVTRSARDHPGLKVLSVTPGGPGAAAGVRRGDLLLAISDRPLGALDDLRSILRHSEVGQSLRLEVVREVERMDLSVEVGGR